MASITNVKICDGYDGLIKTSNNAAITSTPVQLTDGLGNNLPIQVGTNSTIFSQTVDFTNATVLGAAGEKGDKGDQGIQGVTGATGPAGAKGDKGDAGIASNGYYASFYDNTDQVISAVGTPQRVNIANTTLSNGVSLIGPKIVIANAGVYDMRVTLQFSNPNNSVAQVKAWLRFNGADYPNSAHYVSLAPRKSSTEPFEVVTTFGFVGESLLANDYIEIYWESDTSLVQLEAVAGTGHPDSGSVYVNVSNVAEVVTGAQGDKGDTGAAGAKGDKGDTGAAGAGVLSTDINQTSYTAVNQVENYVLACELIPANTFTTNDVLALVGGIYADEAGTGSTFSWNIYIEPSCSGAGSIITPSGELLVADVQGAGANYFIVDKKLFVNSSNTQMGRSLNVYTHNDGTPTANDSAIAGQYTSSPYFDNLNIDWTQEQYLTIVISMFATGQNIRCDHLTLAKINS